MWHISNRSISGLKFHKMESQSQLNGGSQSYKEILTANTPYLDKSQLARLRTIGNSQHTQGNKARHLRNNNYRPTAQESQSGTPTLASTHKSINFKRSSHQNMPIDRGIKMRLTETMQQQNSLESFSSRQAAQNESSSIYNAIDTTNGVKQKATALLQKKSNYHLRKAQRCKTPSSTIFQNKENKQKTDADFDRYNKGGRMTNSISKTNHRNFFEEHLELVAKALRSVVKSVYKDPDSAFAAFNFRGEATIGLDDILNHMVIKRTGYDREDIKSYLLRDKVFASETSEIDFSRFKKFFFPQLMLIEDRAERDLMKQEDFVLQAFNQNNDQKRNQEDEQASLTGHPGANLAQDQHEKYVRDKLVKMTKFLRERFQKTWVSVRKAFLDLDIDKDGEISPEDIMRYFGDASNNLFDYFDLVKILEDLDSKGKGKLGYNDFCKWMGGAIHKSEGFYFRHDSIKNPPFEENQAKNARLSQKVMDTQDLKLQLARKFEFQWKTLQSAFKHLNLGRTGKIQKWELKYFCNHWGFKMTDEQFDEVFSDMDENQDGVLDYAEFSNAIGSILFPPENFYFRQDLKQKTMSNVCSVPDCSFAPVGYHSLCIMHNKQNRMKSMSILGSIKQKLGPQWAVFINNLKSEASKQLDKQSSSDGISVDLTFVVQLLKTTYNFSLPEQDQETLFKTFGAKSENQAVRLINLKPILQLESHQKMTNAYKNIQYRMDDFGDFNEEDTAGYFGTNHRMKEKHTQQFTPLKDFEVLLQVMAQDFQLVKILQTIRTIDKDRNGFVTNQELEDILKLCYKKQLGKYDLKPLFKDFASQSNRLLIDYKRFKTAICEGLQNLEGLASPVGSSSKTISLASKLISPNQSQKTRFGAFSEDKNHNIAAGIKSQDRKFTALDAINGYEKFGDSTEGFLDTRFSKKVDLFTSPPNNFSPQYNAQSSNRIIRRNIRIVSQRDNLVSSAMKSVSPKQNDEVIRNLQKASMRQTNNKSVNQNKLASQKQSFGLLKQYIPGRNRVTITDRSTERELASNDITLGEQEDQTSVHGLSQLGFFNQRKASKTRDKIASINNLTSSTAGEAVDSNNSRSQTIDVQQRKLKNKLTIKGGASPKASNFGDTQNSHTINICNNDGSLQTITLPGNLNQGKNSRKLEKINQLKDFINSSQFDIHGSKNIPINQNVPSRRQVQKLISASNTSVEASPDAMVSPLKFTNQMISEAAASARKDNQYLQKFHASSYSIASNANSFISVNQVNSKKRLGQKLAYEWKNVFRGLKQNETFPKGQGYVTKATLERVLQENGVKMTKHEFKTLSQLFKEELQNGTTVINFVKMSHELGLHSSKLQMMQPSLAGSASNAGGLASETRSQASATNLIKLKSTMSSKASNIFKNKISGV